MGNVLDSVSILECERTRTRLGARSATPLFGIPFQSSSASEPAPDGYEWLPVCQQYRFNPRVRANPHPTPHLAPKFLGRITRFNPRVRANPHPTPCKAATIESISVSILECERTRTRHPTTLFSPFATMFQSSSASEPAPDSPSCGGSAVNSLFQSSSASEPAPDLKLLVAQTAYLCVSILECERTRTRPFHKLRHCWRACSFNPRVRANPHPTTAQPTTPVVPTVKFQSSSASEPAPDPVKRQFVFLPLVCFNPRVRANPHPTHAEGN